METVKFRTYCGLGGDLQELLIAETSDGYKESILISRVGWFRLFFMRRAKKKLINRLELLTARRYNENNKD